MSDKPTAQHVCKLEEGTTWEANLNTEAGIAEARSILGNPMVDAMLKSKKDGLPTSAKLTIIDVDLETKTITLNSSAGILPEGDK